MHALHPAEVKLSAPAMPSFGMVPSRIRKSALQKTVLSSCCQIGKRERKSSNAITRLLFHTDDYDYRNNTTHTPKVLILQSP